MVIDPWGGIRAVLPKGEGVVVASVDPELQRRLRASLPALDHRKIKDSETGEPERLN
jgi:nitrilase